MIEKIISKLRQLTGDTVDDALSTLGQLSPYPNKNIFTDLLRTALNDNYTDIASVLKDTTSLFSFASEQERFQRYMLYTSIYKRIPFCKRAIKVITANILSPDTVSKTTVSITKTEDVADEEVSIENIDVVLENCKYLAKKYDFPKLVRRHISEALYKGDSFIAIVPENFITQHLLNEQYENNEISVQIIEATIDNIDDDGNEKRIQESTSVLLKDLPGYKTGDNDASSNVEKQSVNRVKIKSFPPERVITIMVDDVCFGYIVLLAEQNQIYSQQLQLQQSTSLTLASKIIDKLMSLNSLDKSIKQQLAAELSHVISQVKFSSRLKAMYFPPTLMQHIKIESPEYEPYGESVFSGLELDAKILLALKTALAVHRITTASERRIVAIEIGLPRNASNAINEFKNVMRKRKVTLDSVGTLDAIPSMIGTFETIYLPMKDGRRFIEFDRLDSLGDVTTKVDELKSIRDSIISGTGVPPLFLGVDEVEKKATASHQNILFTRDIVDYQEMFSRQFTDFLHKLYKQVFSDSQDYTYLSYIRISFPPPKNLQIEMTAELVSSISSMISSLKDLDIPVEYLTREFLSNLLDWKKIDEYKQKEKLTQTKSEGETEGTPGF